MATDKKYKTVLGELIRGEIKLPLETAQKKRIQLEKKQEKQSGSWIKLEEPADEINCVKVGDTKEKGKQCIKQRGYRMYVGRLEDMVRCNIEIRHKPIIIRTHKIRRMYIRKLYNLTFKKNIHSERLVNQ